MFGSALLWLLKRLMNKSLKIEKNISLKKFTSWNVGGEAEHYCSPDSVEQVKEALLYGYKNKLKVTILAGGTNVLISDEGVKGLVIHTHNLTGIENVSINEKEVTMEVLSGTPKAEVLKEFMKLRLRPAIFFAGLPGDMGGGVVMNAGVGHKISPKEFCEVVKSIEVLECTEEGKVKEKAFTKDEIEWSYRKSKNWQPGIITKVVVGWPNDPDDNILKEVRDGNKRRKSTQPLNMPSCGSVFKNPEGNHSGALIEQAGLKGKSVGGAQVSEKHANFIINTGSATASEIAELIQYVQNTVEEKYSVKLTNEVIYLGVWPESV